MFEIGTFEYTGPSASTVVVNVPGNLFLQAALVLAWVRADSSTDGDVSGPGFRYVISTDPLPSGLHLTVLEATPSESPSTLTFSKASGLIEHVIVRVYDPDDGVYDLSFNSYAQGDIPGLPSTGPIPLPDPPERVALGWAVKGSDKHLLALGGFENVFGDNANFLLADDTAPSTGSYPGLSVGAGSDPDTWAAIAVAFVRTGDTPGGGGTDPPPPPSFQDRVRLTLSKQVSNVGRSGAIQFADYAISLTTTPDVRLAAGSKGVIGHALDPTTPALAYYVKKIDESGGLLTCTGETILARMARERPADFIKEGPLTGKEVLEYILSRWQEQYKWLEWEPLPEFYLSGDTQMPKFPGLLLLNDEKATFSSRKTMRAWLEEYFRVFEGYTFQVGASGKLKVVPPPWLDTRARITLTLDDFIQMAEGEDTESVRNLATITSQGLEFPSGDTIVTDESYTYPGLGPGGALVLNHDVKPGTNVTVKDVSGTITYTAGLDYLFYNPGSTGHSEIQRLPSGSIGPGATVRVSYVYRSNLPEVMVPSGFALWGRIPLLNNFVPWGPKPSDLSLDYKPLGPTRPDGAYAQPPILDMNSSGTLVRYWPSKWPLQDTILLVGDSIDIRWNVKDWLSQWQTGDIGPYDNRGKGTLPKDKQEHLIGVTVFTAPGTDNFSLQQAKLWLYGRWDDGANDGIKGIYLRAEVWLADQKIPPPFATGVWIHGIWVQLGGAGTKLQKSSRSYSGSYGERDTDLPGVVESRGAFGLREERFDTGLLSVPDPVLLAKIARSKVLERLNPAKIVVAQIAPPFRVGMEDIGREFILPGPNNSTRKGILESLDYSEAHETASSQVALSARFRVTENLMAGQGSSSQTGVSVYGEAFYTGGVYSQGGSSGGGSSGGGTGGSPNPGSTLPNGFAPTIYHKNSNPGDILGNPEYYQNLPFAGFVVNTEESWNLMLGGLARSKAVMVDEILRLQAALPGRKIMVMLHMQPQGSQGAAGLFDDTLWNRINTNAALFASALEEARSKGADVMGAFDPEGTNLEDGSDWTLTGNANKAAQRGAELGAAVHPVSRNIRWLFLHGLYRGWPGTPAWAVGEVSIPGWSPDPVGAQTGCDFRPGAAWQGQFIAAGIGIKPRRWAINGLEAYQFRTRAHFARAIDYMHNLGRIITDPLIMPPSLAGSYTDWVATGCAVSNVNNPGPLPTNAASLGQALNNAIISADSDAVVWPYAEAVPTQAVMAAWAAAIQNPHEV